MTLTSAGVNRTYVRYVPKGLEAGQPAPMVIDFPAYSPATLEEDFSGLTKPDGDGNVLADEVGAVVVTPEPVNGSGALLTWNYVGTEGWTDDQAFTTDVLDDVQGAACIDEGRVLATGFAVGAVFASIYTCDHADRIAVLATVSGLYRPAGCDSSDAVPVISIHGTGDRFIPYDGGIGSGSAGLGLTTETIAGLVFMAKRPGAVASSTAWADHNGCAAKPEKSTVNDRVTRQVWTGCAESSAVELFTIAGGEHTWPGSVGMASYVSLLGPVSDAINANDLIWGFFETHT
ncbi:MAG: PHB depolymerase family esterase [Aquihabitans sp.]